MTILSLIRLKAVSSGKKPGPVTNYTYLKAFIMVFLIILAATVIAVIPLIPNLEDMFVNAMYYGPSNRLFIGAPDKDKHLSILQEYYGRISKTLNWATIKSMVNGMFTNDHGGVKGKKLQFYGNDGVCLFKYFVQASDPQIYYVWSILLINLSCFMIITVSYFYINSITVKSAKKLEQTEKEKDKNHRTYEHILIFLFF